MLPSFIAALQVMLLFVSAGTVDLDRALDLYYDAEYEAMLELLGDDCAKAYDAAACERLRAFGLGAIGDEEGARAAFGRMLDADFEADLDDDVSPKLRALFAKVKESRKKIKIDLAPVRLSSDESPWEVRLRAPEDFEINSVTVSISPNGTDEFYDLQLRRREGAWIGVFKPPSGRVGVAEYFLKIANSTGGDLLIGSRALPKTVLVALIDDEAAHEKKPPKVGDEGEGLPQWALWSIIGGSAALVATVVAMAIVFSRDPEPGAMRVDIRLQGAP